MTFEIFEYLLEWTEGDTERSSIVFIGRKLMMMAEPYRNTVGRIKFIPFYPNKNDSYIDGT